MERVREPGTEERDAESAPGFGREALEALMVVAAFAGLGLLWAAVEGRVRVPLAPYPPAMAPEAEAGPERPGIWLVDGFNALCVGLLGGRERDDWWSEERRRELVTRLAAFPEPEAEMWVVFDGPRPTDPDVGGGTGLRTVFAPSADAWLLARVRAAAEPQRVAVVTADRRLAERVRKSGAQVVSPGALLARCGPEPNLSS